jgi:hypothetical protein
MKYGFRKEWKKNKKRGSVRRLAAGRGKKEGRRSRRI